MSEEPRPYFYYVRDEKRRPITTVCMIFSPDGEHVAIGRAVCSKKDNPVKAIGRLYAEGRARKFYKKGMSSAIPTFVRLQNDRSRGEIFTGAVFECLPKYEDTLKLVKHFTEEDKAMIKKFVDLKKEEV